MENENLLSGDFVKRDMIVDGKLWQEILSNHRACVEILKGLTDKDPELGEFIKIDENYKIAGNSVADLQALISRFDEAGEQGGNFPPSLRGPGGCTTTLFIKAYLGRFASEDGSLRVEGDDIVPVNPEHSIKTRGKIRLYKFTEDGNDHYRGSGRLIVDVLHEIYTSEFDFFKIQPSRTEYYRWNIKIQEYQVHLWNDGKGFPNFPYPDLQGRPNLDVSEALTEEPKIIFPEHSLNPGHPQGIWQRCLDHKLYAEGSDHITIFDIYRSVNGAALRRLKNDHPCYEVTDESCIDLMFKGYPPLNKLPPQIEYCLGRCDHPGIVNTGGE